MDIVAPILAYLTCVAGIVAAFVVSFSVVFSTPDRAPLPEQSAAVVAPSPLKMAALPDPRPVTAKNDKSDKLAINQTPTTTQKREAILRAAAAQQAVPTQPSAAQKLAAIDARQKSKISRAQWRQMVQQERSRRLAYQQNSDFETRFLGYAD